MIKSETKSNKQNVANVHNGAADKWQAGVAHVGWRC